MVKSLIIVSEWQRLMLYNLLIFMAWCQTGAKPLPESLMAKVNANTYRKVSNIRHTETQTLNDSRLVLRLFLPNTMKSGVMSRMKM